MRYNRFSMQGHRILGNGLSEIHFDNKELIHINWKGYRFTVVNNEHGGHNS